jgi:LuxR family maltose regulon positive regulatory protein
MQSLILYAQGKIKESIATATQALEIVPEQDNHVRGLAYYALASVYQLLEDYPRTVETYQMAIQHSREAENLVAETMSTVGLAMLAIRHGQLHLAFEIAAPLSARMERMDLLPPTSAGVYGLLGQVYHQWGDIGQARGHVLRAVHLSTLGGYNTVTAFYQVLLSRLFEMEGDLESAAREIQRAVDLLQMKTPDDIRQEVVSQQARVYLGRDHPAAARMALQGRGFSFQDGFSFPEPPPGRSISHSLGLLYNSGLRVLLYQARFGRDSTSLRSGIELAGRVIAGALESQYLIVALEALLLRAQMYAVLGDHPASCADYDRALELAEPEGIIGVFVEQGPPVAQALEDLVNQDQLGTVQLDHVERILAAFSRSQPPTQDSLAETGTEALIEPLTDRELDVLRLMAQGLKYKEIAARLFISLNTVRFHVKAIYGKLDVNNRTQATTVAHQLRLL